MIFSTTVVFTKDDNDYCLIDSDNQVIEGQMTYTIEDLLLFYKLLTINVTEAICTSCNKPFTIAEKIIDKEGNRAIFCYECSNDFTSNIFR